MPSLISTPPFIPAESPASGVTDRASRILLLDALSPASASAHALPRLSALAQSIIDASCIGDDDEASGVAAPSAHDEEAERGHRIAWSISNRYYSAQVHFAPRHIPLLSAAGAVSSATRSRGATAAARERQVAQRAAESSGAGDDADEELRAKTRDIFATLASSSATVVGESSLGRGTAAASRASELIALELKDVDAVVLVVDRTLPLSLHQALLSAPPAGISSEPIDADDPPTLLDTSSLSVALVIALPGSALLAASSRSDIASLRSLYLEYGWEFIDLGAEAEVELDDEEQGNEQLDEDEEEGEGLARVKEALQAHVWPGMVRKDGRRRRPEQARSQTRLAADLSAAAGFSQWRAAEEEEDEEGDESSLPALSADAEAERRAAALLASLGPLPSNDDAEPSAQDEALAKAFLAHLESLDGQGSDLDQAAQLESFLAHNDPAWPSAAASAAAPASSSQAPSTSFDDDFADFVSAPAPSSAAAGDKLDLDAALRDAEDPTLDFEAAFKNIHAEAARVRAIADPQRRRDEAERVALAFGAALGE